MNRSRDWMEQAQSDLEHGRHDLAAGYYEWACFSAQQAAEKAVKAVLKHYGLEGWGHSIADLLITLSTRTVVPDELQDMAHELDKGYIATRYPDALPAGAPRSRYTRTEAERYLFYAEEIVRFCDGLLS